MARPPKGVSAHSKSRTAKVVTQRASSGQARVWLMRLGLATVVPLLVLLLAEFGLRLTGWGYDTSFLLPKEINGRQVLVENDRFAWRFFGPELAREPFPLAISRQKPPDIVRIFVFGESAAYGDPQPEFGLARQLEAVLSGRFPGKHFEVINAAMTAINSHAIRAIARDCAKHEGDVWILYMGNNEVVGPFGAGTVFGPQGANLGLVRISLAIKATRIGQVFDSLLRRLKKTPDKEKEWGGMQMFVENKLRQDDPRMGTVYANFEQNLKDILVVARHHGVKVVVSTVASNLKDCAPFASMHRPGLTSSSLAEWDGFFKQGVEACRAGRATEGAKLLQQAAGIDDSYADLHYLWGQCCFALGKEKESLEQLRLARDLDALRFRADSRINEIIRQTAANDQSHGITFIDGEEALARQSPRDLVGNEMFYEHVHLRFEGNYVLAKSFAEEVVKLMPELTSTTDHPWPTAEQCAARLAWTEFNRREADMAMLARISDPPFTEQLNHAAQYQDLSAEVQKLQPAIAPGSLEQAELRIQTALRQAPEDWVLNKLLATVREKRRNFAGAADAWRQVLERLPQYAAGWQELGRDLAEAKRDTDAVAAFETALKLYPASVVAWCALAQLSAQAGNQAEAIRLYERALRIKPYWSSAHLGLGKALEATGRTTEAQSHYQQALASRVYTPTTLNALAGFCFEKGWLKEAVTNFNDSLRLNPSDAAVHANLGQILALLGHHAEAQEHYIEALRLDPTLAEAHVRLGLEYGRQGHDDQALEHFAEAVQLKPGFLEARLNLGIALLNQHREAEARQEFQDVRRQDPANQTALRYLQRLDGGTHNLPGAK